MKKRKKVVTRKHKNKKAKKVKKLHPRIIRKKKSKNIPKIVKTSSSKILKKKKVKLKKVSRVPIGIKKFDKLIEGGFEYGSVNLVVGGIGSGKTIFSMEFLIEGIKRNEPCLYIAFEESKEEFYNNMKEFGWDLKKAEDSGKFTFLEYSPEKVKMMLDEGGGAIESIVIRKKIKRLVIDSISSFSLLFDEESSRRQAIISLFDILKKWDNTALLTLQKDPQIYEMGKIYPSELQADSIINIYFPNINNKRKRYIEILKMRGTKHSTEMHELTIGNKGMEIGRAIKKKF